MSNIDKETLDKADENLNSELMKVAEAFNMYHKNIENSKFNLLCKMHNYNTKRKFHRIEHDIQYLPIDSFYQVLRETLDFSVDKSHK